MALPVAGQAVVVKNESSSDRKEWARAKDNYVGRMKRVPTPFIPSPAEIEEEWKLVMQCLRRSRLWAADGFLYDRHGSVVDYVPSRLKLSEIMRIRRDLIRSARLRHSTNTQAQEGNLLDLLAEIEARTKGGGYG